ncbi:DivIVA domain-containing protein [Geodermatophilus sp. SYSU D00684]
MTTHQVAPDGRRLTPADVREVRFTRSSMLHPGYSDAEVDRFLDRVGEELARLHAEKAELRGRVQELQAQVGEERPREEPTAQAVSLLAVAQQTADQYVAEAETFSRVMVSEAQQQYDEQLQSAREKVGAMIQAAHEAAARIVAEGGVPAAPEAARTAEELQEQVAYLQAFGQACRTQLRSYLEALIGEVERAWGHADPTAVPVLDSRAPATRPAPPPGAPAPGAGPAPAQEPPTVEAAAVLLGEQSLGSGSADAAPGQVATGPARDRS